MKTFSLRTVSVAKLSAVIGLAIGATTALGQVAGDSVFGLRIGTTASSSNVTPANVVNGVNFVRYTFNGTTWNAGTSIAASPTGAGALTINGASTSEGALSLSPNGRYAGFAGYRTGTNSSGTARILAQLDVTTNTLDTSTSIPVTEGYTGSNSIRAAAWNDAGDRFWAAGTGSSSTGGTRTNSFGSTTGSTQVSASVTNTRVTGIFGTQLYTSSASGAFLGVSTVGSGLPTTSGNTTTNVLDAAVSSSSYGFSIAPNGLTAYVADDRATASGGIQKWTRANTAVNFTFVTVFGTGVANIGARGLSVDWLKSNPVIYAGTADATNNRFIVFEDAAGTQTNLANIAFSGSNDIFRGVQFNTVPEPASLTLFGVAAALMSLRRRRSM